MRRDHRPAASTTAQNGATLTEASQKSAEPQGDARRQRARLHQTRLQSHDREAELAATRRFLGGVFPYEDDRPADGAGRAFALLAERWVMAILNEFADEPLRAADLEKRLDVPRRTLSLRLKSLVAEGLLERHPYALRPPKFEYRLSPLGWQLYPALAHIASWGENQFLAQQGRPLSGWVSSGGGQLEDDVPDSILAAS